MSREQFAVGTREYRQRTCVKEFHTPEVDRNGQLTIQNRFMQRTFKHIRTARQSDPRFVEANDKYTILDSLIHSMITLGSAPRILCFHPMSG
jgi:hypothetical protein